MTLIPRPKVLLLSAVTAAVLVSSCTAGTPGRGLVVFNECDTEITVEFFATRLGTTFPSESEAVLDVRSGQSTGIGGTLRQDLAVVVVGSGYREEIRFASEDDRANEDIVVTVAGDSCPG